MAEKQRTIAENVCIEGMAGEGRGFGKVNGKVVFADYALPGDVVDIEIRRSKKSFAEGVIKALLTPSGNRIKPNCTHFGVCGGCKWQHAAYAEQLNYKRQNVMDAFTRIGKISFPEIPPVLG
ncbi:MAG TPA: TRAM domain-containing protein, partial [Chitinophagales bacterium]|nr:TRAM domain-containing protein [Chitinophagales bacterium]